MMRFPGAMFLALVIAIAVAKPVGKMQPKPEEKMQHPVIKKADVGDKAFLGKASSGTDCGADPNCGKSVNMVLVVNNVLQKAEEVEKKAEKAETKSKQLVEAVNEVKAASKEESGAVASAAAAAEKVETVKAQVKNEELEIREKEQVAEQEQAEIKKITDPKAKEVMQKDEAEMEAEVKGQKIEAEVAKLKETAVKQDEQVVAMKAIASKANEEAKEEKFTAEEKSVTQTEEQIDPKAVYKVEVAVFEVQTQVVKDAAKASATPTATEQIVAAEVPKVQLAVQVISQAKAEAADAKVEQEKAVAIMKEVKDEAKTEEQVDQVVKEFGSVKELDAKIKECGDCLKKGSATPATPPQAPPAAMLF